MFSGFRKRKNMVFCHSSKEKHGFLFSKRETQCFLSFEQVFFELPTGGGRRRRHRPQQNHRNKIIVFANVAVGVLAFLAERGPKSNLLFLVSTFCEYGACPAFCALFGNLLFSTLLFCESTFFERPVGLHNPENVPAPSEGRGLLVLRYL